jgi:serine/threonine-protein kinase
VVGAVIGNYQLVRKLGKGGMGAVYLGEHQLLGRRAAIKVLLPELSARPDIVKRFFNEARAVTSISDPGIVQVFDFGYHSDGSAFIVMEYLDGEPLDRRLARLGRLPVHETMRLARQLAISLAAAHAQGIVHRDLKPENVFLVPDAEVASGERSKILDFGIAKLSDEHPGKLKTHTGTLMGTPTYMSPEQCRGLGDVDHRSDIYSLGCVLFHLLTGRPPFEGEAPGDIMAAHIREPAPPPSSRAPEIPPGVDALVLRCLAKAPADRFQSMGELTAAVAAMPPQLSVGTAEAHPMPMPALPTTVRMPASGTPVPPGALAPGAGRAPPTSTTLGASSGQLTAARTPLPETSVPPAPPERRIGLWIAGGLIVAAAGIGIAIVGAGPGPARVMSRPDPAVIEGSSPGSSSTAQGGGPGEQGTSPARATEGAPVAARSDTSGAANAAAPAASNEPASASTAAGAPAAARAATPAPADAADHAPAAATVAADRSEPRTAGGAPQAPKDPARPARDVAGHDAGKRPAHRKRSAPEPAHDEPAPGAAVAAPAPAPTAPRPAPPAAAKPGSDPCSKTAFAAVYNASAPSKDAVRAAIRTLNACHTAGAISDADYDQTQAALVSRF